jgi:hypothetical protein
LKEGSFLLHNPVPKVEVVVPMTGQGDIEREDLQTRVLAKSAVKHK